MNIEKTKVSWGFFAIYLITYLYVGICIGNTMSRMLNLGGTALSCIIVVMVILLAFVGCAAALIVLIKARPKDEKAAALRRRRALKNGSFFVKEVLPALAAYLLVMISRGVYIVQFSGGKLSGDVGMYERITAGSGVDFGSFFGIGRLYALLMRSFCILLGNVPDAVYILNLICQVVLVFCCYLFLRMAAGRAAAIASAVLFLCIPYFYRAVGMCEPQQLFMALCAVVICILTALMKRSVFDTGGKGLIPAYLLCGLLSGALLMLDLTALLIPAVVIVLFFTTVRERRAELLMFILGMIAGMALGTVLLNLGYSGSQPLAQRAFDDFSNYMTYYEDALCAPVWFLALPEDLLLLSVIAFGGVAAVLFFWCQHDVLRIIAVPYFGMILFERTGNGFLFACVGVITAAMTVGIIYLTGQPVMNVSVPVHDKDSEQNSEKEKSAKERRKEKREEKKKEQAERRAQAEKKAQIEKKEQTEKKEQAEKKAQIEKKEQTEKKEQAEKEAQTEKKEQIEKKDQIVRNQEPGGMKAEGTGKIEDTAEKEEVTSKQETEKPRMIENPLPLPKKREHREMDYAYEVSEDRMHFDVEIRDQDDFDY